MMKHAYNVIASEREPTVCKSHRNHLLPASLVDSEVCRVVWRGQTIAISLHQGLDEELAYLQCVTAIRYWMMEHPDLRKLIVSQEAREVVIVDPMPLTQLQHRPKETRSDE